MECEWLEGTRLLFGDSFSRPGAARCSVFLWGEPSSWGRNMDYQKDNGLYNQMALGLTQQHLHVY